jgi:hypothetical protein
VTEPLRAIDPSSMARQGFRYGHLAIGVASSEPSHIAWLQEFLTPAFRLTAPEGSDRWVVVDTDATKHAALLARGPSPEAPPVPCFALDGRIVRHPEWAGSEPDERTIFDTDYRAFYVIDRRGGHVRIVVPPRSRLVRSALMRVVREMAMVACHRGDGLLLHGAAFAVGARGVVLAGPKRAGKTTLLLHALQAAGTAFVANDRVLLHREDGRLRLRGMPTVVKLRPSTLATFPAMAERIQTRDYQHTRTLAEDDPPAQRPGKPAGDGSARLTQTQLCEVAGTTPRSEADAWALVFPHVSDGVSGIRLAPLDTGTAARRLRAAWFTAEFPGQVSEAFSSPDGEVTIDEAVLHRRAAELTVGLPCYDVLLGVGAYGGASAADEFIAELARQAPYTEEARP